MSEDNDKLGDAVAHLKNTIIKDNRFIEGRKNRFLEWLDQIEAELFKSAGIEPEPN